MHIESETQEEMVPSPPHPLLSQGRTQGSTLRAHQQALPIGPFGNTCEADAVSPEAAMRGLQERYVYNQGNIKWFLLQQQHKMHLSLN
jgi:hypothetical protein